MTQTLVPAVRTVLGDVPAHELGHIQPHEHVLADASLYLEVPEDMPFSDRYWLDQPVSLENYQHIRRNPFCCRDNLVRFDVAEAIEVVALYKEWGGGTVVDSTSIGLGRDPVGLARVSRATGVHIVMGGGLYIDPVHPRWAREADEGELTDAFVRDIEVGVNGTGIRTGLLGEIGISPEPTPAEERGLRAAVSAQRQTGVPLQIHAVTLGAARRALDVVSASGGDPTRTIMAHIDLQSIHPGDVLEFAQSGAWLELDLFGFEQPLLSDGPHGSVSQASDSQRIEMVLGLIEEGYLGQLLLSQDLAMKMQTTKYGGEGLQHILENVFPLARSMGMTGEQLDRVTRVNPARALSLQSTTSV